MIYGFKKIGATVLYFVSACFFVIISAGAQENAVNEPVTFSEGAISINVKEMRAEDLMKKIGEKCGIKIIVYGDVFSEVPLSIQFQKMPLREGLKRVLRIVNITNYLMHFEELGNETRVVGLDLIGQKGGERHLTSGTDTGARIKPKPKKEEPREPASRRAKKKGLKENFDKEEALEIQENFLNIMDQVLSSQLEGGEEPDPEEILKLFKEVVPPEMRDQIPPEVLEELERLE